MENYSYHVPFYIVNGGVATAGHSADLSGGKIGLYDRQNFSVATGIGNGKEFFFAQGATGGLDWYGQQISESHKSPFFYGKDVEDIYLSNPVRPVNEEWVIGYNGSPSSVSLNYTKGEATRVKFYFHGEPTYRFFNGPKEYVVSYTPKEDCTTPCETGDCPEGITDCLTHTQELINLINTHTELRKFGVTAKLVRNDFSAATTTMTKWCLTLCDNGDGTALKAVQAQAPVGVVVTRSERIGSLSTYTFCALDAVTPSAFQQTGSVLQAVCEDCPDDSFLIGAKDVYIVKRPIVGGENFTSAATRDAYANTLWQAYATAASITTSTSTTSTTTASGADGNPDATFVGQDGSLAIVKVKFASGSTINAVGADLIEFSHTEQAVCVFDTPASISWTECGVGISSSRTLVIKNLNRPDCDADGDRIDDLTVALAGVKGINIGSLALVPGDGCKDDYTVTQNSLDCLDESCLTQNVTFTYDSLPAFENNSWR